MIVVPIKSKLSYVIQKHYTIYQNWISIRNDLVLICKLTEIESRNVIDKDNSTVEYIFRKDIYIRVGGVLYCGGYQVAIHIDFNSYGNVNTQQLLALEESTVDTF